MVSRILSIVFLFYLLVLMPVASSTEGMAQKSPEKNTFDITIAPLLSSKCLSCHSGIEPKGGLDLSRGTTAQKGGDSGKVILPGKPKESLLWQRINDDEMPPEHPLSADEKTIFKKWMTNGAKWGTDKIDPFLETTEKRAGYNWWSLQPLKNPIPPLLNASSWPRNEIDHFILHRLRTNGLAPSSEAAPRVLIRRLYLDLTGLPPSSEEVKKFVANPSDKSYRDVVEKLLASPRYGERWARHWLDVVRFGESDGFERNAPRRTFWHYRDWVIRALNDDMPYNHFVKMQIAGDILDPNSDGVAAASFLVAGVHNTVVGSSERMKRLARQDELEEIIGTIGQTFLGLTVNCARCHDHKFDPIPSKDYYRMIAAIDGVNHGEKTIIHNNVLSRLKPLAKEISHRRNQINKIYEEARRKILSNKNSETTNRNARLNFPKPIAAWEFDRDLRDQLGNLHGRIVGDARIENGALVLNGRDAYVVTNRLEHDLAEKTLEAWVLLDNLEQRGGSPMSVESHDGAVFDAIVFGEQQPGHWMPGSNNFRRTKSFGASKENLAVQQPVHIAIVYRSDGFIVGYRNGIPYGKPYQTSPVTFRKDKARVVFGLRHSPSNPQKLLKGKVLRAQLYNKALTAKEIAISSRRENGFLSESEIASSMSRSRKVHLQKLKAELLKLENERQQIQAKSKYKIFSVISRNPAPMRIHLRGSVSQFGEEVSAGGISGLKVLDSDFGLKKNATDADRRRKLAEWIVDSSNPLLARVIVNRIWHHHFGTGIVETPNDFGFNGGRPSHPKLLDWLASSFQNRNYSLKKLHRLIVLSSTYRQSSRNDKLKQKKDASNRLLWRYPLRRMEAEVLRDSILQIAGKLNTTMYGPGFVDVKISSNNGTTYYLPFDPVGSDFRRRTIYRFSPRGERSAILDTFDCPDPSTTTPRRNVTTTPLQALSLLNNSFVWRMSDDFAKRIQNKSGDNEERQINLAWQIIYHRPPDSVEAQLAKKLVSKHGLSVLCRALFNSNEFIVIE